MKKDNFICKDVKIFMYLIFWRIIQFWIISLTVSIMKKMVVHQVPSPTLVIRPQQRHISMTLCLSLLCRYAYNCHSPQWSLPYHFPSMTPTSKSDFSPLNSVSSSYHYTKFNQGKINRYSNFKQGNQNHEQVNMSQTIEVCCLFS